MSRVRLFGIIIIIPVILFAYMGCYDPTDLQDNSKSLDESSKASEVFEVKKEDTVVLLFSLDLNRRIYEKSDWGEPPQVAIWLEDPTSQVIKTVFVTYRSASGDWIGKVSCSAALPYWFGRYNEEANTTGPPTYRKPAPLAITGATPELGITAQAKVSPKSKWNYFIEVNVAGDYNGDFPSMRENGMPDPQGNGQPSLIYKGSVVAEPGFKSSPILIGRTEQWNPTDKITTDVNGITTAKEVLGKIEVTCLAPQNN